MSCGFYRVHGQCSDFLFIIVVAGLYGLVSGVLLACLHSWHYILMSVYYMLSDIMTVIDNPADNWTVCP